MNATMTIEHRTFISSDKFSIPEWLRINWIGTVRDPIDRVASWYYFRSRTRTFRPGILDLNYDSFDECVEDYHSECYYPDRRDLFQYSFFCGNAMECNAFNNRDAVQMAKYNVERYYSVVGVLEEMNQTISVFQAYLPRYFGIADKVFHGLVKPTPGPKKYWMRSTEIEAMDPTLPPEVRSNKGFNKKPVQPRTRQILMTNPVYTLEYEFYYFVLQRLHLQFDAITRLKMAHN